MSEFDTKEKQTTWLAAELSAALDKYPHLPIVILDDDTKELFDLFSLAVIDHDGVTMLQLSGRYYDNIVGKKR